MRSCRSRARAQGDAVGLRPAIWLVATAVLALCCLPAVPGFADVVDDAMKLPPEEALVRLEALLTDAESRLADARTAEPRNRVEEAERAVRRIQEALARILIARGEPYAALTALEALARGRGQALDSIRYGEALVAVARNNVAGGRSTAAGVVPYLQDALASVASLSLQPPGAEPAAEEAAERLRARHAALVAEAHYLLRDYDAALATLALAEIDSLPAAARAGLRDLEARSHYAAGRWADAAAAFERAGNPLGAAAAWDAARQPEKSIPLYARVVRTDPAQAAWIGQAMSGARFTGAQAALLSAMEGIPVPDGTAGVPLLEARAELLEAVGRPKDAIDCLRDVVARFPASVRGRVGVARLVLLTGDKADEDVWDAAADAYAEAFEQDPGSEGALAGLSFIAGREFGRLWSHWRNERVVRRCVRIQQAIVEGSPDDALALSNLANTLRVLGRAAESLATYERARQANPFDPSVESDYGLALAGAGRDSDALAAYERSLELDPGHLAGRQNAARALWLSGEDDRAAQHLGAAVRTARAVGRSPGTYRFLLDRTWRTRRDAALR